MNIKNSVCGRVASLQMAGIIHSPSIDSGCRLYDQTIMPWMGYGLAWCNGVTV